MSSASGVPFTLHIDRAAIRRWASQTAFAFVVGVSSLCATLLIAVLLGLGPLAEREGLRVDQSTNVIFKVVNDLLIAPFFETAIMGWFIILFLDLKVNRFVVVTISAFLWAALHQTQNPIGWMVFFPFFFYSYLYIKRRERTNPDAFIVVAMTHFYYNATAIIWAMAGGGLTGHP